MHASLFFFITLPQQMSACFFCSSSQLKGASRRGARERRLKHLFDDTFSLEHRSNASRWERQRNVARALKSAHRTICIRTMHNGVQRVVCGCYFLSASFPQDRQRHVEWRFMRCAAAGTRQKSSGCVHFQHACFLRWCFTEIGFLPFILLSLLTFFRQIMSEDCIVCRTRNRVLEYISFF